MYPVSSGFLAALGYPHALATTQLLTDPSTGNQLLPGLRLDGGSVTIDRTAAIRRTCQCSVVVDTGVVPGDASDPLAPFGNQVQLFRGMIVPASGIVAAATELAPLGVFRLQTTGVQDNEDGTLTIQFTGSDKSRKFARNKFTNQYFVAAGTNYITAILALIANRDPTSVVNCSVTTTELTPQMTLDIGADPWDALTNMCAAIGVEAFYDVNGAVTVQSVPDPTVNPVVFSFIEGQAGNTMTDVGREFDDEPGFNGVTMSGESSSLSAPVFATVWDTDPDSPTYYLGKYGQVPDNQSSPYVGTIAQAVAFGTAYMLKNLGVTSQVTFSAIPNPALDADDIVYFQRTRSGISDVVVVESLTIPLDASSKMTGTCAKRTAV